MTYLTALSSFFSVALSWIRTICIFAAILTIGPWILALLIDILLYAFRSIKYEIPVVGGRARGRAPPEPPNVTDGKGLPVTEKVEEIVESIVDDVASAAGSRRGSFEGDGRVRKRVGGDYGHD